MIDLGVLYLVLREVALVRRIISYKQLSVLYFRETGEQHNPHGTWDAPLGDLNAVTHRAGLPAISSIVTYQIDEDDPDSQYGPPGNEYWGTPGVPPRPRNAGDREIVWLGLVNAVHNAVWPNALPGL